MSNELDRMLADNLTSTRMNQAKQIAKTTAEVAMLAVGVNGKAILSKAASSLKPALSTGAKAGYDTLGKRVFNKAKLVLKEGSKKLVPTLNKGSEMVGKEVVGQIKGKVEGEIKQQLPPELAALIETTSKLSNTQNILNSFKAPLPKGPNEIINAASQIALGKADLTHGVVGYADKVLKTATGKPSNYALKVLTGGEKQLDRMIGQTTKDLLNDTKKMLESAKDDAEADDDDRSEAAIKRMHKA